jgi:alkylated DNA nucleotide flippase Atl1
MPYTRKTWQEKLHDEKDLPKVVQLHKSRWMDADTMVVPAPLEVDEIMRSVPKGKVVTVNRIREKLAQKHNVDVGCPITTGIFSWIAAHAAMEEEKAGKKRITSWWRTIKSDGELNPKFPGGVKEQAKRLRKEGLVIIAGRKKSTMMVKDFQKHTI